MDDLISRRAAIDALEGEIEVIGKANAEAVLKYTKMVCDRIKALPSAQSEPRWIPVEDEQPKEKKRYWISTVTAVGYPEIVAYAKRVSVFSDLVRCKDCKYLSKDEIAPEFYRICRRYGVGKPDNGFCDEGERSEDVD